MQVLQAGVDLPCTLQAKGDSCSMSDLGSTASWKEPSARRTTNDEDADDTWGDGGTPARQRVLSLQVPSQKQASESVGFSCAAKPTEAPEDELYENNSVTGGGHDVSFQRRARSGVRFGELFVDENDEDAVTATQMREREEQMRLLTYRQWPWCSILPPLYLGTHRLSNKTR